MERKPKFVRKTNEIKLKEEVNSYDSFIRQTFRSLNSETDKHTKVNMLREGYYQICSEDVIKNELFVSRLRRLSKKIQLVKPSLTQQYLSVLKLLNRAQILDSTTYEELLNDFGPYQPKITHSMIQKFIDSLIDKEVDPETRKARDEYIEQVLEEFKTINFKKFDPSVELLVNYEYKGSCVNGLALLFSDYDISISTLEFVDERELLNFFYGEIKEKLEGVFGSKGFEIKKITHANIRVPLVRVFIRNVKVNIDFCVNSQLGVQNSKLLNTYMSFDNRCYLLTLLVKIWAKTHRVLGAMKMFLSSYALSLLVVNFLQTLEKPILPSLQTLSTNKKVIEVTRTIQGKLQIFESRVDFEDDQEKLTEIKKQFSSNKMPVEELLRKFFKFYSQVGKFEGIKFSVRTGGHLPRPEEEANLLYSIEDPFDTNNPGLSLKKNFNQAKTFIATMKKSYKLLRENKFEEVFQPLKREKFTLD